MARSLAQKTIHNHLFLTISMLKYLKIFKNRTKTHGENKGNGQN